MFLKKPITVAALSCNPPAFASPLHSQCLARRHSASSICASSDLQSHRKRWYATPRSSRGDDLGDIPPWPTTIHPSPYDIFAIRHSDPYTKRRFYQLVKIYHPDLTTPSSSHLPAAVRLERYRLIVAANDILCDPAKRRAYDLSGAGWTSSARNSSIRNADRAWRDRPGNAAANATWEDWERWYESRDGRSRQETVYMPNGVFAILIAMTGIIGAMVQTERVERSGSYYMEAKAAQNQAVGEDVRRSTMASAGLSKDERVGRFLRDRENVAFAFMPGKYDEPPPPPADTGHGR